MSNEVFYVFLLLLPNKCSRLERQVIKFGHHRLKSDTGVKIGLWCLTLNTSV